MRFKAIANTIWEERGEKRRLQRDAQAFIKGTESRLYSGGIICTRGIRKVVSSVINSARNDKLMFFSHQIIYLVSQKQNQVNLSNSCFSIASENQQV